MKMSQLFGCRLKENPADATTASHKFLVRGGYVRPVAAGIYSLLPMGKRVVAKIESIIRQEMDRVGGQEVLMPVVLPADLWVESGRYESVGAELLRFKDRNDKSMVLGMTHEEASCQIARTEINSYKQLPVMIYQIQTKYRDEARPRAGLLRVREFTMKDAYSFHTSQEDLDAYYQVLHEAYERIFRRVGMTHVVSILSNTGMMGGSVSHEFMLLADCGEDNIFLSPDGKSYKANREVAVSGLKFERTGDELPLEKVATPHSKTIEEVATFLGVTPAQTGKAVFYSTEDGKELIFVLIRGDFEVNECKLKNVLGLNAIKFADDALIRSCGAVPGYASPVGISEVPGKVRLVIDPSAAGTVNLVVGANEEGFHYKNFNYGRDMTGGLVADVACVREGDPCPVTGEPLQFKHGIEIGNIFQLGLKYSKSMKVNFLDKDGKSKPMYMGCYGIGVGRTMASVIEDNHDDYGPIWPMSIAPYQVHIVALQPNGSDAGEKAEALYNDLQSKGVEVLLDDRGEKAGFMFSDADLLGIPFRVIVSPKTLANGMVEFRTRASRDSEMIPLEQAAEVLAARVREELNRYL